MSLIVALSQSKGRKQKNTGGLFDSHGMHVQVGGTAKFACNRREIKASFYPYYRLCVFHLPPWLWFASELLESCFHSLRVFDSHGMHVQVGGTAKFACNRREIKEIRPRISNDFYPYYRLCVFHLPPWLWFASELLESCFHSLRVCK
jgi:hypothetical protein